MSRGAHFVTSPSSPPPQRINAPTWRPGRSFERRATPIADAYARARARMLELPAAEACIRLFWVDGHDVGWREIGRERDGHLVIGRHTQCDVLLGGDPEVALRHLLARVDWTSDGVPVLRLLDLHTERGFELSSGEMVRSTSAMGPVAFRVGRYALCAIPCEPPEALPPPTVERADAPDEGLLYRRGPSSIRVLPPSRPLSGLSLPRHVTGQLTLSSPKGSAQVNLGADQLEQGVLIGRDPRCEPLMLRLLDGCISRVHLMLLREPSGVFVYDLASMNGTYAADMRPLRRAELFDGTTLRLGHSIRLSWRGR
jgi:hypothetical protein